MSLYNYKSIEAEIKKMKKSQKRILKYGIIIVAISIILTGVLLNLPKSHTNYSWATDPQRQTLPETVTNVTLIVDYGTENGTNSTYTDVNLTDHYTSVFDLLNKCCTINYTIYWWNHPSFFITSINHLSSNDAEQAYWLYDVNGVYQQAACNAIAPPNNSVVLWYYSK